MAIKFSVHKTPQPNDRKGQQQTHARAIARSTQKMDDICALVCERGSISSADVKAVLDSFVWVIGHSLKYGRKTRQRKFPLFGKAEERAEIRPTGKGKNGCRLYAGGTQDEDAGVPAPQ